MNGYSSLSLLISRKRFFDRLLLSIIFLLSMAVGILLVHAYWQQEKWLEYNALRYAQWYTQNLQSQKISPHPPLFRRASIKTTHVTAYFNFVSPTQNEQGWTEGKLGFFLESLFSTPRESGIKLYSPYPFFNQDIKLTETENHALATIEKIRKKSLPDEFATAAWQALTVQPQIPFYRIEQRDGQSILRYAAAQRMQAYCLDCHNQHPASPKKDWQLDEVAGILELNFLVRDHFIAQILVDMGGLLGGIILIGVIGLIFILAKFYREQKLLIKYIQQLIKNNRLLYLQYAQVADLEATKQEKSEVDDK
jgi:hypothetical protein